MAMRWSICVWTETAAGNLAAALHNQVIAFDIGSHAVASQQSRSRRQTIQFLDTQFLEPAHDGYAFGKSSRHGKDRIFIYHRRCARCRNLDRM